MTLSGRVTIAHDVYLQIAFCFFTAAKYMQPNHC